MATVAIIGDGPAGLSAALFVAKNGHRAVVFGTDKTAMHAAQLHNYLGLDDVHGSDFQATARAQVAQHGAELRNEAVQSVARDGTTCTVRAGEDALAADYVVLAGAKPTQSFAEELGAQITDGRVVVDNEYRTTADRVYAVGRLARPTRSQAIISAGAGATAALDILAREEGKDVQDWDTPPKDA